VKTKLILGPPGTGKTTRLLEIMEQEMATGVEPDQIAFVAFTRKAADEAKIRAKKKFGLSGGDLPYFRTLHSLCFRELGVQRSEMIGYKHFKEMSNILGLKFTGYFDPSDTIADYASGDAQYAMYQLARTIKQPLKQVWHDKHGQMAWEALEFFKEVYEEYKQQHYIIDFTDLLEGYVRESNSVNVKVAIIDEAQDLSTLQWQVVEQAFVDVERMYIAGDDDQAIFHWAGADILHFLNLKGEQDILTYSYRLPKKIFDLSQKIVHRIQNRYDKVFLPKKNGEGKINYLNQLEALDILAHDSWLLIARNRFMLKNYERFLKDLGLMYSTRAGKSVDNKHCTAIYAWEDLRKGKSISKARADRLDTYINERTDIAGKKECVLKDFNTEPEPWFNALSLIPFSDRQYYREIMRKGNKLTDPATIHVDTIHGVKGGEADNVCLMVDMAYRSFESYQHGSDNEHRVFYVGATRARQSLNILLSQDEYYYDI